MSVGAWIAYVGFFGALCLLAGVVVAADDGVWRGVAMAGVISMVAPLGPLICLALVAALGPAGVWWGLGVAMAVGAVGLAYVFGLVGASR